MDAQWQHQVRVYLGEETAALLRAEPGAAVLAPLQGVLERHRAAMVSQFDAFDAYVAEAEREGPEGFALYRWTKATLDDPVKRAAHATTFALHVGGETLYSREAADGVEADLRGLVGGGVVERVSRHDTNPANNMAIPAEFREA
ncbi:MAG: hypothetical protein ACRYGC_08975 [Janthinobacterium lividum]